MKSDDLPPLETDVLDILRAERGTSEPTPAMKARMLAAVSARVEGPPGGGGGGGTPGGGGGNAHAPSSLLSGWRAPVAIAAAFLLGIATHAALSPGLPVVVVAPRAEGDVSATAARVSAPAPTSPVAEIPAYAPSALPNAPALSAGTSASAGTAASASAGTAASVSAGTAASGEPDNRGLTGERTLLDIARTALANGDSERALTAVARHEKAYPNGLLIEEREAMAVKALVAAGRNDEARARGARFARRFPSGLMRPAVDGALRSLPEPPP